MSRALASLLPEHRVKSENALRQPAPVQEVEARKSAASVRTGEPGPLVNSGKSSTSERLEGSGRPLSEGQRTEMETRLGHDFSDVRVHTDSEASGIADRLGARALAYGNDIVFGSGEFHPQSESGRELLAHELTHIAQQSVDGPAIQMDPKGSKGGIGSNPPKEPFFVSDEAGAEDSFVLFGLDHTDLSGADAKKLQRMVATHKGPVTVVIHGYASQEGEAGYNVNLGAHRAAAIKAAIESSLPKGSKVTLFSNGQTTLFGPSEKNRRAGIAITDGVAAEQTTSETKKDDQKKKEDQKKGGTGDSTTTTTGSGAGGIGGIGGVGGITDVDAGGVLGGFGSRTPQPPYLKPLETPFSSTDIDWPSITGKYRLHGLLPDSRDLDAIGAHARYSYNFFRGLSLTDDQAKDLTNIAVPFAVGTYLSQEHPNVQDEADAQFKRLYPDSTTIIVPFSSILDAALKKAFDRKKSFFEFD